MSDINISMIEFILFMWGALATAAALQYRDLRACQPHKPFAPLDVASGE